MGDFETPEHLKQFAESRGYTIKSIKLSSKRHHFRIAYSTDEYRAIAWEQYAFEDLTLEHARKIFPDREKTENPEHIDRRCEDCRFFGTQWCTLKHKLEPNVCPHFTRKTEVNP